jgi:hypothetical protein
MEECYFTYSYSPLVSDDGSVQGLFTAVTETTTRIITERQTRYRSGFSFSRLIWLLLSHHRHVSALHTEQFATYRFEEKRPAR